MFGSLMALFHCSLTPPSSSRDCGAVTQAVEEEGRDVRTGVLRYLNTYSCRMFCELSINF